MMLSITKHKYQSHTILYQRRTVPLASGAIDGHGRADGLVRRLLRGSVGALRLVQPRLLLDLRVQLTFLLGGIIFCCCLFQMCSTLLQTNLHQYQLMSVFNDEFGLGLITTIVELRLLIKIAKGRYILSLER